jgi:hypothetical protein
VPANNPLCRWREQRSLRDGRGDAEVKDSLTIISKQPVRFFDQQSELSVVTRRADMTNDPTPNRDRLSDLHRCGPRRRANPPNPGHRPIISTRISALTTH